MKRIFFISFAIGCLTMLLNGCISSHEIRLPPEDRNYFSALALSDNHSNRVWFVALDPHGHSPRSAVAVLVFSRTGTPMGAWESGNQSLDSADPAITIKGSSDELAHKVIHSTVGADVILLDSSDVKMSPDMRRGFWNTLPSNWAPSDDGLAATNQQFR